MDHLVDITETASPVTEILRHLAVVGVALP